jgi:multiple sugar transport system substrate-binding protein
MRKSVFSVVALLVLASMLLAACAPAAPAAPQIVEVTKVVEKAVEVTKEVQVTSAVQPTAEPLKDRVQIYWYIGLGAGAQPAQIPPEKAFVEKFNASQKEIQLIPIIVDNKYARDNLTAQIAAGNSPDIVGPVGTEGRAAFPGAFLDLDPLIKEFNYDTKDIDPAFLEFYKEEGKVVGLPFAIFPEFVYVNKDLFKEAGMNLPPQKYGEKYKWADGTEEEWNFDTMAKLAKKLTVDKAGNDATSPKFDKTKIVQWGYDAQWTDSPRAIGSLFGAAYPADKDGNAVITDGWKAAWKWYYDGEFGKEPFIPNQASIDGDLLKGNAFSSGKIAMATTHLWYTCCVDPKTVKSWDLAVMPSYKGKVTSKMHGDTFAIMNGSKHPKEAFKVYSYLLGEGSADLYKIYGGLPARKSQQAAFFADLDKKFEPNKANWQVALDSIPFMDTPNHQQGLPNNAKANDAFQKFGSLLRSKTGLDVDKAIADFVKELDGIFKEKPAQ